MPRQIRSLHREAEMKRLIRLLLEEPLGEDEKATVPTVVKNVLNETTSTPEASQIHVVEGREIDLRRRNQDYW
jgi:hypothetical protein